MKRVRLKFSLTSHYWNSRFPRALLKHNKRKDENENSKTTKLTWRLKNILSSKIRAYERNTFGLVTKQPCERGRGCSTYPPPPPPPFSLFNCIFFGGGGGRLFEVGAYPSWALFKFLRPMQTDATSANNSQHCWVRCCWPTMLPTLLCFHANARNKSRRCWAQQCWVLLANTCWHLLRIVWNRSNV